MTTLLKKSAFSLLGLVIFLTALFAFTPAAHAACNNGEQGLNLFDCFLLNDRETVSSVYSTPVVLVSLLVRLAFILSGLVIFLILLYGGFLMIQDDAKGKDQAQQMFTTAAMGFVIMFAAYWIIQIIKVFTGADILI